MKILCVIDNLGSGGAQRQLVNLAIGFKERGHDVSFLVYLPQFFFKIILNANGIPITTIIESNNVKCILKLRTYIRSGNYDIVLSFLDSPNIICELAGLPFHNWKLFVGERSANPIILKSVKLIFIRFLHIFADKVISNSYANIKMIQKINPFLSQNKCRVIYNMIDFDIWKPSSNYIPYKNGKFTILVAASHGLTKNLNGLVEAINLLPFDNKKRLKIKWYGEDRGDLARKVAIKNISKYQLQEIFEFYPPTLDIATHMQEADCIGLFSFFEGLPNAICEGMALGKPIVASSISDLPLILDSEYLCDPNNPISIAAALKNILSLSSQQLIKIGENNRKQAISLFDKHAIIDSYLTLFSN